jgi:hypothetical protein|tara:strand:+ start:74490 stop:74939 length:450 start_codon:yes stop_codon:yes gene_type:complete
MIGVLLGTVYDSPKNILAIKNINRLKDAGVESCLFCDIVNRNFSVPVETSVLQRAQAFNFNGSVITHDLSMAQELRHMVYAKKRYLYLYDLDWMRIEDLHFSHLRSTILDDSIDLIARNDVHYKLISDMFKKPKHTMEYWDANVLKELD